MAISEESGREGCLGIDGALAEVKSAEVAKRKRGRIGE